MFHNLTIKEFDKILSVVPPHSRDIVVGKARFNEILTDEEAAFVEMLNLINITMTGFAHYDEYKDEPNFRQDYLDELLKKVRDDFAKDFQFSRESGLDVTGRVHFLKPLNYLDDSIDPKLANASIMCYLAAVNGYKLELGKDEHNRFLQKLDGSLRYGTFKNLEDGSPLHLPYMLLQNGDKRLTDDQFVNGILAKISGAELGVEQ